MPPITNIDLQQCRVVSSAYRNRRLGDFLKEVHLTEGRATGMPLIHQSLNFNGSPDAVLYTDEQRTVFLVTLKVHKAFENELVVSPVHEYTLDNWEDLVVFINQVVVEVSGKSGVQDNAQVSAQVRSILSAIGINVEKTVKVLESIEILPSTRQDILSQLGLPNHYKNYDAYNFTIKRTWPPGLYNSR